MCEKYNGWTDRATWVAAMMVDGNYNEGDYDYWQSVVEELAGEAEDADEHKRLVESALSTWFDEAVDEAGIGLFFRDLLDEPQWWEIAVHLVDGWKENGGKYEEEEGDEEDTE